MCFVHISSSIGFHVESMLDIINKLFICLHLTTAVIELKWSVIESYRTVKCETGSKICNMRDKSMRKSSNNQRLIGYESMNLKYTHKSCR